jgi:hypothetical protein
VLERLEELAVSAEENLGSVLIERQRLLTPG